MVSSFTSGSPARLVSRQRTPDNTAAESTANQLTSSIIAVVPMVATAVCEVVLIARTPAALNHIPPRTTLYYSEIFLTVNQVVLKFLFGVLHLLDVVAVNSVVEKR